MDREARARATRQNDSRTLKILLALFLFVCFTIVSVGYGGFYLMNQEAEQAQSATATGQAIATHAAATAFVHATATGISHATQIAGYEIYDDFSTNPHNWETGIEHNDYWDGVISVRNGLYTWDIREIKDPNSYSWRGYDQKTSHQNFDLSVEAKLVKGSPDSLCYGLAFRASPRDFTNGAYLFTVCDSGVYEVWYENDVDGSNEIVPWTRSDAIRSGGPNTISVSANGKHISVSINNVVVSEFTDEHLIEGYVFLLVRMYDDKPGMIHFDNFAYQPR